MPHIKLTTSRSITAVAFALGIGVAFALAGPLAPPSGPVGSTYKTLFEVEPRTPIFQTTVPVVIDEPGSYYLAENIVNPAKSNAVMVVIDADRVTLDLNGFAIDGAVEAGDTFTVLGVDCAFDREDITIRNGKISRCSVGVEAIQARRVTIEDVEFAHENIGTSVQTGFESVVRRCLMRDAATGVHTTAQFVTIEDCVVTTPGSGGFVFDGASVATLARSRVQGGLLGVQIISGSNITVMDCAVLNANFGFIGTGGTANTFVRNLAKGCATGYTSVPDVSTNPSTATGWINLDH